MNLFNLSLSYLRRRPLTVALNVLLLALGVATIVVLLLFSRQLTQNLSRDAQGIDLVVGSKGSPLQLILSSIYHIDAPTGNIRLSDARVVMRNPAVRHSIPLSLGDSYRGFPIVGTTHDYPAHYEAAPAQGQLWEGTYEATVGARVAREAGLNVGDTFVSSHGLSEVGPGHGSTPLRVVGILGETGTVIDRLVLTSLETVWAVHDDHPAPASGEAHDDHADEAHGDRDEPAGEAAASTRPAVPPMERMTVLGPMGSLAAAASPQDAGREITAVLVQYSSPMAAVLFPRAVNGMDNLQAASPAMEIARLMNLLGVGADVLRAFGFILILTALLGVFVTLYTALRERRYDLAMMRTLGASRTKLLLHVLIEGLILAAMGLLVGLILGHVAASVVGGMVEAEQGFRLTGLDWHPGEALLALGALGVGIMAALIPAVQAYRTDISQTLAVG